VLLESKESEAAFGDILPDTFGIQSADRMAEHLEADVTVDDLMS